MSTSPGTLEVWRSQDGSEVAIIAPTWILNPRVTFASLADEFKKNPAKSWRNYGSVIGDHMEGALRDAGLVNERINRLRSSPWNFAHNRFEEWFRGKPRVRYFMHFDLSKNRDATGIALVHQERPDKVIVDFMLRVEAEPGKDIQYGTLREWFVYPLLSRGFAIECVTFDGFQSAETRQVLEEKGIATDYCSADRSNEPYDTLIELLHSSRLDYYTYPPFLREFEELRWTGLKYDHPRRFRNGQKGSKDTADAVACAAFTAIQYELENPAAAPGNLKVYQSAAFNNRRMFGSTSPWD